MPRIVKGRPRGVGVLHFSALYCVSSIYGCILASSSLLLLSQVSMFAPFVSSSSSSSSSSTVNRNTYNVYNYDQTTPQFTPDGRLLQVEYASSAADLSSPLVVFECSPSVTASDNESDSHSHSESYSDRYSDNHPCTVLITLPKHPRSPQNRIVIIEEKDSSYCVVLSGILSDSLALLQAGLKAAAQHSLQYQTFFGMESLAQALADECQSRVFAGGLRPYGSTLLLCGYTDCDDLGDSDCDIDIDSGNRHSNRRRNAMFNPSVIYQTDPSGGILQHHAQRTVGTDDNEPPNHQHRSSSAKTKQRSAATDTTDTTTGSSTEGNAFKSQVRCIVGGSSILQRQLHKRIAQGLTQLEHNARNDRLDHHQPSLAERIACVAKIMIQETTASDRGSKNGDKDKLSDDGESPSLGPPLEIVVVSPVLGCHRLDEKQVQAIKEIIRTGTQGRCR